MAEGLKISAYIEIPSSGYEGEEVGSNQETPTDPGAEGTWHEFNGTYFYRDSQVGNNANSTRVDVVISQQYLYEKAKGNHYKVTVKGYLKSIKRGDKRGTVTCCTTQNPSRTIEVFGVNGKSIFGPKVSNTSNADEVIFEGNAFLGENTYDLGPGEATPLDALSADYRNFTTGYWTGNIPSPYLDQMHMGLMFWNDLPKECDPPVLMGVTQTDDICENTVDVCLRYAPCSCEGMGLVLEYHYDGEDWSAAQAKGQTYRMEASNVGSNIICLNGLPPTNHTARPVHLYFRAKFIPLTSDMPETKWVEDMVTIMFILAPHETVPDISPEECSQLQRGDLIDKYQQEVCYNYSSCADMNVSNPNRDKDVENCKQVNGVA